MVVRHFTFVDALVLLVGLAIIVGLLFAVGTGDLSKEGLACLLVPIVLAGLFLTTYAAWLRTCSVRRRFVSGRIALPDDAYLRQMDVAGDYARFCLIVRFSFSCDCGVPPDMIYPSDSIRELEGLCFDGFFLWEIMFALESEFPDRVGDIRLLNVFKNWKTITFRECVEGAARELGFLSEHPRISL
jgi:hypothetical protein